MVQTDLSSDNFCGFNQSASPFYYTMDPVQNNVEFKIGEIGITPSVGVHTPGEVIKVDSYLKDIGNVLTRCNLPVPASDLKNINKTNCNNNNNNNNKLKPESKNYSKMKVDDLRTLVVTKNLTDNDNALKMKKSDLVAMLYQNKI